MVKIIKDISREYISFHKHIIVKDLKTYFAGRKQFFESYKKNENYEIVIRNKSYFPFFLDFENYENVQIEEIYEVIGPEIDLGSSKNIFEILLNSLNSTLNSKKILEALKKEHLKNYGFLFKNKNIKIKEIINILVKIVVFSKYKKCNFIVLMDDDYTEEMYEISKNDIVLKESFLAQKLNLSKYIDKCNEDLKFNSKKMHLFTEFPTEKYLDEINGDLYFEKEYFLKMNIEKLNQLKNYESIISSLEKAENLFKIDYSDLKNVIFSLLIIKKDIRLEKKTLEEFKEYFITIYLNYNSISENKNLNEIVEKLERKYCVDLSSLKQSIHNIWKVQNTKFEEFYLKNYNNLYSSSEQRGLDYSLQNSVNLLNNGKRNFYIFIDCLRYDIWLGIKKYIESKGYNCHSDKIVLSAIPTVTSYCKRILYCGKKYNQIELGDNFKYPVNKIVSIDDFESLENNTDYLYEIIDLDNFFHSIKDLSDEYLQNSIELKLNKLFQNIDKDNFNIVIMTDHGAIKLSDDGLASFSKYKNILNEKKLQMENHGRYIKIYSDYYDDELCSQLYKYMVEDEDFYIITREEMNRYYLPVVEKDKENYFYLIYKYGKYPKKTGEYNHGGISLEEVMIPFGIFKSELREYIPVQIDIKSEEIKNDSKAELDILIQNNNIIQNVKLKLKYQEYEKEYIELDGNKKIQIPLKLLENLKDSYSDILEAEFYFDDKKYNFEKYIEVKVIKSQKEIMNKKMKSNRQIL
ncbi:MAG: hypothetical protein ACRC5W_05010 [Cetobacterium sp.]